MACVQLFGFGKQEFDFKLVIWPRVWQRNLFGVLQTTVSKELFPCRTLSPVLDEISEKLFTVCSGIREKVPATLQLQLAVAWEAGILLSYETSKMCER